MGIFNSPIEYVKNTKIFAGLDRLQERQLTVFENEVFNATPNNVLILPVPNPDTVQFHEFTNPFDAYFHDLASNFDCIKRTDYDGPASPEQFFAWSRSKIRTESYRNVSIFNCIADLRSSQFDIKEEIIKILKNGYPSTFGFIVCKLDNNTKETLSYRPIAYSFQVHQTASVFLPTLYAAVPKPLHHDVFQPTYLSLVEMQRFRELPVDTSITSTQSYTPPRASTWDHEMYILNYDSDTKGNQHMEKTLLREKDWTYVPTKFVQLTAEEDKEKVVTIRKLAVTSYSQNMDCLLDVMSPEKIGRTVIQYHVTFPYNNLETSEPWVPCSTSKYELRLNNHYVGRMSGYEIWEKFACHPEQYIMKEQTRQFFERYSSDPKLMELCRQRQIIYDEEQQAAAELKRPTPPELPDIEECCQRYDPRFVNFDGHVTTQCHACRRVFKSVTVYFCPHHKSWETSDHFDVSHTPVGLMHKLRNRRTRIFED